MSLPASAVPTRINNPMVDIKRPALPNYRPSIWGDRFLSYPTKSMEHDGNLVQHQRLKEEVQRMLRDPVEKLSEKLELIDAIQRLGVSYHFEREIDDLLGRIYEYRLAKSMWKLMKTFTLLLFVFGYLGNKAIKFQVDNKGNFKESLVHDIRGMLCLYEASHLSVHGEDILDEALKFCTTKLESMVANDLIPSDLAIQVSRALKRPIRKCLPRVEARHYFAIYKESASCNEVLLKFAKLDFNILQKQHQMELCHLSKWWKDLNVAENLPFARDRVVELYFWGLGGGFEPQYSLSRKIFTKVGKKLRRQLLEYMKLIYNVILDVYEEVEEELSKEGRLYCIYYAKEAWLNDKYVPTPEEYMSIALTSSGYLILTTVTFAGMGEIASKEAFDWLFKHPKILKGAQVICRLMDDIVSNEMEQKRAHIASIIECYMKQHGVSKQEAIEEFQKQLASAWKDINEDFLKPTQVAMPLLERVLNLARVIDLLYKDEDAYTNVGEVMVEGITFLLIDPVPI
ncbi:(-)-germacrene D synthase [Morella rubra]|uniref:(-)-germacrene D synthase n=1 Tax=Morella rubra TaxID=262757 RepID=A0A6A1VXC0_9ROSI|nr:(-)-germacrene D synthase [Morella rubra]